MFPDMWSKQILPRLYVKFARLTILGFHLDLARVHNIEEIRRMPVPVVELSRLICCLQNSDVIVFGKNLVNVRRYHCRVLGMRHANGQCQEQTRMKVGKLK